jgi:hypothetical protein
MTRHSIAGALAAAILVLAASGAAGQEPVECPEANAAVAGATEKERALICAGVADASGFLAGCGIERTAPLVVTVHADMREVCDTPAHALYDVRRDRLEIAQLDTCRRATVPGDLFDRLEPDVAYRSLAVHEAAHAIAAAAGIAPKRLAAQEYVAAVVQMSTLPPEARVALTADVARRPIAIGELNATSYGLAPLRFAGKAATHFAQQPDGCAFLRDLVDGEIRLTVAN